MSRPYPVDLPRALRSDMGCCRVCRAKRLGFNISPSRYIHTGEADEYRPIAEIVEELNALAEEAKVTDAALKAILKRIGV